MNTTTHQFQVKGMSCQNCVKAITKAIQELDAEAAVSVDLPQGLLNVQTKLNREDTVKAITDEGYEVQQAA